MFDKKYYNLPLKKGVSRALFKNQNQLVPSFSMYISLNKNDEDQVFSTKETHVMYSH